VVGDLIYNLPNTESMPRHKSSFWKSFSPGKSVHARVINNGVRDRASVQADAKTVAGLDFDRLVPLHGVRKLGYYDRLHMRDADYVGRTLSKRVD
jgi:hypothetical protein